jgi:hypothetical protein
LFDLFNQANAKYQQKKNIRMFNKISYFTGVEEAGMKIFKAEQRLLILI